MNNRIALVTGGSRGIGKAVAEALAQANYTVVVNYQTAQAQAEQVVADIAARGGQAVALRANVADGEQVAQMVQHIEREWGPVSVLVNNAGIGVAYSIEATTEAVFDQTIEVNLKSTFLVTQAVLPAMRRQRWGRIINMSSLAAQTGGMVSLAYAASKAGQLGLTYFYAKNLVREGITVNAIAPAGIETDMIHGLGGNPANMPLGRFGTPEEVAQVVLLLVENAYITGQTINVNAGLYTS
jgi:3-oxoacyl-[acyl-carrier protein] reductase